VRGRCRRPRGRGGEGGWRWSRAGVGVHGGTRAAAGLTAGGRERPERDGFWRLYSVLDDADEEGGTLRRGAASWTARMSGARTAWLARGPWPAPSAYLGAAHGRQMGGGPTVRGPPRRNRGSVRRSPACMARGRRNRRGALERETTTVCPVFISFTGFRNCVTQKF
jgi:hypothetical protein